MVVVEEDDDPGDDGGLHERKAALPVNRIGMAGYASEYLALLC